MMPGETSDTEKLYKPVESKELYAEHTTAQHLVLENTPSDIEARMRRVIATARSPGKTNLRLLHAALQGWALSNDGKRKRGKSKYTRKKKR